MIRCNRCGRPIRFADVFRWLNVATLTLECDCSKHIAGIRAWVLIYSVSGMITTVSLLMHDEISAFLNSLGMGAPSWMIFAACIAVAPLYLFGLAYAIVWNKA